jgi:hypothetical protein
VTEPPRDVTALAELRARARADRDFAAADTLRAEIADQGWLVVDSANGYVLEAKPRYDVLPDVAAIGAARSATSDQRAVVSLLVEGWPDDLRTCLTALLPHLPVDVRVLLLDLGNVDGAGDVAQEFGEAHEVVDVVHVAGPAAFGPARAALLRHDPAPVHIWMETSTIVSGDAVTPLLTALDDSAVVAAGWRGANVDEDWRGFSDAGPGRVEALLGYMFAVRRDAALTVAADITGPLAKARFYRNVDLEFSYALRDGGGDLVVVPDLPVQQTRHRGYHDSDPAYRDRESKRNYDRFLAQYRGREDLRLR